MTTSPLAKSPKPPKELEAVAKKRNPTIEDFDFPDGLPTAEDLPCSDGAPVDKDWSWREPPAKEVRSELQELIPGLLKMILLDLWKDRTDWLFSIDMAFYYRIHLVSNPLLVSSLPIWVPLFLTVSTHGSSTVQSSWLLG
jgi:hypothetical protein